MDIVELIANTLDQPKNKINSYLIGASRKYKVFKIPKRTMGYRVIAQPTRELKEYQRVFLIRVKLPIHPCATAYRSGKSIKDNANKHRKNPYLLRLDLENFFNSIDKNLFWKVWNLHFENEQISIEQKKQLDQLLFWCPSRKNPGKLVLSVGAPTSPYISNFCLYLFDAKLNEICQAQEITYTRYADDLIFSTNKNAVLFNVPREVEKLLNEFFEKKLIINQSKTVFSSKAHNRHVTGITITNDDKLSVGRERKRYIKHLVHQYLNSSLGNEELEHLRGLLAFVDHIEPSFIESLKLKYTDTIIQKITGNIYGNE